VLDNVGWNREEAQIWTKESECRCAPQHDKLDPPISCRSIHA